MLMDFQRILRGKYLKLQVHTCYLKTKPQRPLLKNTLMLQLSRALLAVLLV